MNEFELLMGYGGDADRTALADAMRQRSQMGQMLSLSPTAQVSNLGNAQYKQAYATAGDVGDRRVQALSRARQAEQDAESSKYRALQESRAAQTHQMSQYGAPEWINTPEGMRQLRLNKMTGQYDPIELPEGATPYEKTYGRSGAGGGGIPRFDKYDNPVKLNTKGDLVFADGSDEEWTAEGALARYQGATPTIADRKGEIEGKKEASKSAQERVNDAYESMQSYRMANTATRNGLRNMKSGLEAGANVGTIYNQLPTLWSEATSMFDTGKAQLGLGELKNATLTPVSDNDIAFVFQSASPNLSSDEMLRWIDHKEKSLDILEEMNTATLDFINKYKILPSEVAEDDPRYKEVAALNKKLEGIRSGFDFQFRLGSSTPLTDRPDYQEFMQWKEEKGRK